VINSELSMELHSRKPLLPFLVLCCLLLIPLVSSAPMSSKLHHALCWASFPVPWLSLISWRAVAGSLRLRSRHHPPSLKLTSQVLTSFPLGFTIELFYPSSVRQELVLPPWRRTRARAIWRSVGWKDKAGRSLIF
jgi:hypothetical protein